MNSILSLKINRYTTNLPQVSVRYGAHASLASTVRGSRWRRGRWQKNGSLWRGSLAKAKDLSRWWGRGEALSGSGWRSVGRRRTWGRINLHGFRRLLWGDGRYVPLWNSGRILKRTIHKIYLQSILARQQENIFYQSNLGGKRRYSSHVRARG